MKKRILIDANFPTETRVVVLDKSGNVEAFEYDTDIKKQIKNNIYLAKITRVEPSLQAAFVDYGDEKSGFLPFSEIHPDYYNIPVHDKKAHLQSLSKIELPEITNEDKNEKRQILSSDEIIDSDEINITQIERLVKESIESDYELDVDESDIDRLSNDDYFEEPKYRIQEVIKKGQIVLVQATKEERGNKGASLTTFISLAGKYCVLMPNKPSQNGISRKIANPDERKRLKKIINGIMSSENNASIIVRTAGAGHTNFDIKRDFEYLSKLWNKIRETTLRSTAPSFIHQEDSVMLKAVRDLFDKNVGEVLVQGNDAFQNCIKFVKDMMPGEQGAVKEYRSKTPIFTKYQIEEQLTKLYQTTVNLPSGGYIVINPTEALISIDVNSGKSTSERNIEEMALKTNIEAAREIARQARLRDLSGLLVLDFIDMNSNRNRRIVERTLREFMSKDKARIQTSPISTFGLLELSRQRLRPSFLEVNSAMCNHCSGKGVIRADEANSMLILRTIENEIYNGNYDLVNVYGVASSIVYLLNNKREEISYIEDKYSIKLNFHIDRDATSDSYSIERIKLSERRSKKRDNSAPILQDTSDIYGESEYKSNSSRKKINNRSPHKIKSKEESAGESNRDDSNHNQGQRISGAVGAGAGGSTSDAAVTADTDSASSNTAPGNSRDKNKKPRRQRKNNSRDDTKGKATQSKDGTPDSGMTPKSSHKASETVSQTASQPTSQTASQTASQITDTDSKTTNKETESRKRSAPKKNTRTSGAANKIERVAESDSDNNQTEKILKTDKTAKGAANNRNTNNNRNTKENKERANDADNWSKQNSAQNSAVKNDNLSEHTTNRNTSSTDRKTPSDESSGDKHSEPGVNRRKIVRKAPSKRTVKKAQSKSEAPQ